MKQIQVLAGKLAALNRFISMSSDRLRPFFLALKGAKSKGWDAECDRALEGIKSYFLSWLVLSQPTPGEELFLYLATSQTAMHAILVRAEESGEQIQV